MRTERTWSTQMWLRAIAILFITSLTACDKTREFEEMTETNMPPSAVILSGSSQTSINGSYSSNMVFQMNDSDHKKLVRELQAGKRALCGVVPYFAREFIDENVSIVTCGTRKLAENAYFSWQLYDDNTSLTYHVIR